MRRPDPIVRRVRADLKRKGSPAYARRMQMFFRAPVPAYGWRTEKVRKLAQRLRREIAKTGGNRLLLAVAEKFFAAPSMEEKTLGVALLERAVRKFGDAEFRRLEGWLRWVTNWAACDGLCGTLLGPLILADPRRLRSPVRWATSANQWYRRAAAVALVPVARRGLYLDDVLRLSDRLLRDDDYMVQKGVGWLLKEAADARSREVVRFLLRVRERAPRLVLRTACEKLPASTRRRILS